MILWLKSGCSTLCGTSNQKILNLSIVLTGKRNNIMKKLSCYILVVLLLLCCVSCKKDHKKIPGPNRIDYNDKNNLFIQDGRILMSENPYFILYLGEDSSEQETAIQGVFEDENKEIKHFYFSDLSLIRNKRCALHTTSEKMNVFSLDENTYLTARFINKTDRTTLIVTESAVNKFKEGDKIVLRKIKMEYPETAEFLEKAKTLPKEQMPEVTIDKNPTYMVNPHVK